MATIQIGPGRTYERIDAAAYAALDGGGAANTVVLDSGYVYLPDAGTSRWWGRDQRYGMDKRIAVETSGSAPVWLTGLIYLSDALPASYNATTEVWTIDIVTGSNAYAPTKSEPLYFGAQYGLTSLQLGWRYPIADALANVSGDGLTVAGQRAGKGVWWAEKISTTVKIYIWCPAGPSVRPEVYWGGIATEMRGTSGGIAGACPQHGAFCFQGSATNDPSGSSVIGDIRLVGGSMGLIGTPREDYATAYSTVSDLLFSGVKLYGAGPIQLGSTQSGTTISNVLITGGWELDDRIDPHIQQALPSNEGLFESCVVGSRVRGLVLENGRMISGLSHGLLSWVPSSGSFTGLGDEESRSEGCVARSLRLVGRSGGETAIRAFATRKLYNSIIQGCDVSGMSKASKINGVRTKVLMNRFHSTGVGDTSLGSTYGQAILTINALGNATEDSSIDCQVLCNEFDRRGDASRGVPNPFAAIGFEAFSGDTLPAGVLDMRSNTFLGDAGTVAVRVKTYGTSPEGVVSTNQTAIGNRCSSAMNAEASAAPNGVSGLGTTQTLADLFSTGAVSGNISDTAANILARGDLPARALAIGLPS